MDSCIKWHVTVFSFRTNYVNNVDFLVCCKLLKFVDDTKLFSVVSTVEEIGLLCNNLHNFFVCKQDWPMLHNMEKCKLMHFKSRNSNADYFLSTERLQTTNEERDLDVIVSEDLNC